MSTEQPAGDARPLLPYHECQCAICRPDLTPKEEPQASCVIGLGDLLREFERGVAKTARASDRLRAQRKRHAQREAKLQAKLDEAEARYREAMEIVKYVVGWGPVPYYGPGPIGIDHDIYLKAAALVAREKENKA